MSDSHSANQEFDDLAAALCDGRINASELKRLEQIASSDPVLLSTLVDMLNVDARLQQTIKGEVNADAIRQVMTEAEAEPVINELAPSPRRRISMASRHMAVGITIAVVFVVTSISVMHQILLPERIATKGEGDNEKLAKDPSQIESIARLVNDVDAQWEGHVENPIFGRKERIKTGMKLYPGQKLKLASGLAEFKFFNGAEVVLEGPAEFEVQGKKQCRLELGNLVAKAFEERSKGFIVDTPTAHVEDLGTEFAVSVDARGFCDVHVFSGKVRTTAYTTSGQKDTEHLLVANQSITVADDGRVASRGVAEPNRFAARLPRPDDLHIPDEYVAAIKSAAPIVYWRFEDITAGIRNEMSDTFHGRTVGRISHLEAGPTNHTIDFGPVRSGEIGRHVVCDTSTTGLLRGDYTVEFWMHADEATGMPLLFTCYDQGGALVGTALHVEYQPAGTENRKNLHSIRYLHRSPPGLTGGQNVFSSEQSLVGRWVHVVAVKEGDVCKLYVDGRHQGTAKGAANLPVVSRLVLGRNIAPDPGVERYFVGQFDELAVYDRALTKEEVSRHFRLIANPLRK